MSAYQPPEDQDYIEVQQAYDSQEEYWDDGDQTGRYSSTPRQSKLAPPPSTHSGKSRSKRKGSKAAPTTAQSGSDTEKESSKMSSRVSKHSSSSSRKDKSSSSKSKKTDDWTDVTEPDERRRIQNRNAQRKFREKAREQKDRALREAQNQQYAGSAYHIPDAEDLTFDDGGDLSGLPWGGINVRHVVARGHAAASSGHHTVSHHSGHSSNAAAAAASSSVHMGSHPVDPTAAAAAIYGIHPYGYAPQMNAASVAGDAYGAGYHDSVSYASGGGAGGYYDYDTAGAGDMHQM